MSSGHDKRCPYDCSRRRAIEAGFTGRLLTPQESWERFSTQMELILATSGIAEAARVGETLSRALSRESQSWFTGGRPEPAGPDDFDATANGGT